MDQTIPMTYRGREVGTAAMRREGLYCVVECRCEPVSDEVLRAYGHGGGRSLPLGVLVPEDGALHLRRRVALSRLPAGGLETVSVGDENPWQPWSGTCRGVALTGCRRGTRDGRAVLAMPFDRRQPLPSLALAREAEPMELEGRWWLTVPADWAE